MHSPVRLSRRAVRFRQNVALLTISDLSPQSLPAVPTYRRSQQRGLSNSKSYAADSRSRLSGFWTPSGGITKKTDNVLGREDSHDMLVRAGYVRQSASGLYHYLALGQRVQDKIEKLLDKHMRSVGASRLAMSTLSAVDLWQRSGRWVADKTEFFRLADRKGTEYLLSPTHEEEVTRLVADAVSSHRDLPLRLYQITRKYRDELRPRQGLLRTREFLMKDLYTFDADRDAAVIAYNDVSKAYRAFFDEFGVPYLVANADSGNIGGDFSHEYHFLSAKGEDDVYTCDACSTVINGELLAIEAGENQGNPKACPECYKGSLKAHKSVELGHTFFLGTKYSEPLGARITSAADVKAAPGTTVPIQMGCYGIGVSRLIATMADLQCDERGLQWPKVMAPFTVCVIPAPGVETDGAVVYDILSMTAPSAGVDPVLDDRSADAGFSLAWKLNDADLVGYPVLVVLGRSWKRERKVEVQARKLGIRQDVDLADLNTFMRELFAKL